MNKRCGCEVGGGILDLDPGFTCGYHADLALVDDVIESAHCDGNEDGSHDEQNCRRCKAFDAIYRLERAHD